MSSIAAHTESTPLAGGASTFLLRRLHSLTGLMFGGYLLVHLLVNATIAQGGTVYQEQVDKIHSLPFLIGVEWAAIFLPILYHGGYGLYMTLTGQWNTTNYPFYRNIFYLLQRISAIVLIFFIVFHVLSLKYHLFGTQLSFEPHKHALATIGRHMQAAWWVAHVIYPIGILAACYHVANGFWAAGITWGLTVSAGAQKRWGLVCLAIFVGTLVAGFVALVASTRLDWQTMMVTMVV